MRENGNRGGKRYAAVAAEEHDSGLRHVAAMESDAGGFHAPRRADGCPARDCRHGARLGGDPGAAFTTSDEVALADIGPLKAQTSPSLAGLVPDGQLLTCLGQDALWENVLSGAQLGAACAAWS